MKPYRLWPLPEHTERRLKRPKTPLLMKLDPTGMTLHGKPATISEGQFNAGPPTACSTYAEGGARWAYRLVGGVTFAENPYLGRSGNQEPPQGKDDPEQPA